MLPNDSSGADAPSLPSDFPITVFDAPNEPDGDEHSFTWPELVDTFCEPQKGAKEDVPLWSPATYQGPRCEENVVRVYALGFDVDVEPVPDLDALLSAFGRYRGFVHSSASHRTKTEKNRNASDRWRMILVLSRPVSGDEYRRLWSAIELPFPVGEQSQDPCRQWYLPTANPAGEYVFEELTGEPVDVDALLAKAPVVVPAESSMKLAAGSSPSIDPSRRAAGVAMFRAHWPKLGKRHAARLALAGALFRDGWSEEHAVDFVLDVCGREQEHKHAQAVRDTYRRATEGKLPTGWASLADLMPRNVVDLVRDTLKPPATVPDALKGREAGPSNDTHADGFVFGGLDGEEEPIDWLVDDFLPRASVGMFAGESSARKTWLALDLARAVSKGGKWMGRNVRKGLALIIDYEMGASKVRRRMRLLREDGSVGRWSMPEHELTDDRLWKIIEARKPALVIVDSLSAGNPTADENDTRFAAPLKMAKRVAESTGASFIFIHHVTKDPTAKKASRIRGTSAIRGDLDVCYFLESTGSKTSSVECIKVREGEEPGPFMFQLTNERGIELVATGQTHAPTAVVAKGQAKALDVYVERLRKTKYQLAGATVSKNALANMIVGERNQKLKAISMMCNSGELFECERGVRFPGSVDPSSDASELVRRDDPSSDASELVRRTGSRSGSAQ